MKILFAFLLAFVVMEGGSQRRRISMDDNWSFHFGHAGDPKKDFNYSISNIFSKTGAAVNTAIDPRFDDSKWRKLDLPHDWAVELPFVNVDNFDVMAHGYKPVGGLFPKPALDGTEKFHGSRADSGQRFRVNSMASFPMRTSGVNGFYLGNH